ncbi:kinase activator [Nannizzia gypsea CBS 118893]|uniref:Kinase activator n=1 Tax=Arthroderma gypseum (strain ATCC MYA-4604 / CBS 118893) TaxID=535722 RepID=E4V6M7_ARTGP|nr:kinase activator [Nannizzia gypsea CBS 118893]EFQ96743.1 kinase activator [Nannizzia gypsea CBS 118893]
MSNFFQSVRQGFGRGSNKSSNNAAASSAGNTASNTPSGSINSTTNNNSSHSSSHNNNNTGNTHSGNNGGSSLHRAADGAGFSPGFPHGQAAMPAPPSASQAAMEQQPAQPDQRDSIKYFFQEKYASLNVKGNFLTLCACPKNVELGEWLAHQVVEQNRLLHGMLQVIQEINSITGYPICNEMTCPTMSAGNLTYTWLVDGKAARISAPKFINRVEKWIVSKIHDPVMFPTDPVSATPITFGYTEQANGEVPSGQPQPQQQQATDPSQDWIGKSSGFPPTFYKDCQGIMKQMFRCYAHLYHGHWENPFWHINKHEVLNMCFVHFVTVAKYYKLVSDKELEPMQPLIDIYTKQEKIPPEALAGHWAQHSSQS